MTSLHVLAFKLNGPKLNSLQQTHAKQFYLLLQSELLTSDSSMLKNNDISAVQHDWAGGCGRTSSTWHIMQLHYSTFWNCLSPMINVLLLTAELPYTAHKCLWMFTTVYFCGKECYHNSRFVTQVVQGHHWNW